MFKVEKLRFREASVFPNPSCEKYQICWFGPSLVAKASFPTAPDCFLNHHEAGKKCSCSGPSCACYLVAYRKFETPCWENLGRRIWNRKWKIFHQTSKCTWQDRTKRLWPWKCTDPFVLEVPVTMDAVPLSSWPLDQGSPSTSAAKITGNR